MIIYKTTNLINGKIYVGKDSFNDPYYIGSGLILNHAIYKYGIHNFKKEILEHCKTPDELNEREKYWIEMLKSTDRNIGYNIAKGGSGGDTFTSQSLERKIEIRKKIDASKLLWDTPEYRKRISENCKRMWKNSSYRNNMVNKMTGRTISWADKISNSIREWHKSNPISKESRLRGIEKCRLKMIGKELKPVSLDTKQKIIDLYQIYGPVLISTKLEEEGIFVSRYLITKILKKAGIYKKWQKGVGEKSKKHASISRCGSGNPMFKENIK